MNAIDVIKTELACVQRDCCRVENQCAKCDLVLPVEEIISAYKKCISVLLEYEQLENKIADIKANRDLAIEGRDVKIMELESELEQAKKVKVVEHFEAFGQCRDSRRIAGLEQQIEKMKCCGNCIHCKYDQNEESNEYCEKHQQIVNVAIQPCCEWEGYKND